jgi:PPIC-type peptidyl-prolyl cis-trans isomerase-like protein
MTQTKDLTMTDHVELTREGRAASASPFEVPDWAPLSVLGALVSFGLLGGLGVIPIQLPGLTANPSRSDAAAAAEAPAKDAGKGPRVTLKPGQRGTKPPVQPPAPLAAPSAAEAGADGTISVAHLVVSHAESALGKAMKIQRTRDEARKRAGEALVRARKGEDFSKLVVEYSDEKNAATRFGKFTGFRRTDAIAPFGDTAFALKPGQISDVIETKLGFHVIRRD